MKLAAEKDKITETEINQVTKLVFNSFSVKDIAAIEDNTKDRDVIILKLEKQRQLIDSFTDFLNKYFELHFLEDKKRKLEVIDFIDKLKRQKELIDLKKGITNVDHIKVAAKRMGRKAQSGFSSK